MAVNVEPGVGEGGIVETTKLVTVSVGFSTTLEGDKAGESELVSGGREGEEESGGLENGVVVGGKDEGSVISELGVIEGGDIEGRVLVREGMDVKEGGEMIVSLGVNVGEILSFVEEGGREEGGREEGGREEGGKEEGGKEEGGKEEGGKEEGGKEEGGRDELGVVMEDGGGVINEVMVGEIEDTELEMVTDEDDVTEDDSEDDTLELDEETTEVELED